MNTIPTFTHFLDFDIQYYKDGIEQIKSLDFDGWIYDEGN
jgi:hypothetical protein